MFRITVVVENTVAMPFRTGIRPGLLGEHGLAVLIEHRNQMWLYDTGRGKALLPNLEVLGVKPDDLAGLFISHGHLDHFGALKALLEKRSIPLPIYAHPDIFVRRFTQIGETARPVGMLWNQQELEACGGVFYLQREAVFLEPDMWLSGEIPRKNDLENIGEGFWVERKGQQEPDLIFDDQALVMRGEKGLVILTGCAHAGIINILESVKKQCPGIPVYGIMGGLHLVNAHPKRIAFTADKLKQEKIGFMAVGHCTGAKEAWQLAGLMPIEIEPLHTGEIYQFQ